MRVTLRVSPHPHDRVIEDGPLPTAILAVILQRVPDLMLRQNVEFLPAPV